mgnify:CR=1 FL=1
MAEKVISMKIWSAVIAKAEGLEVNVAGECARAGVSRALFYKLLDRYNAEGAAGLELLADEDHVEGADATHPTAWFRAAWRW